MIVDSRLYENCGDFVICKTCNHYCRLKNGQWGRCRVRKNENGTLKVYNYGIVTSVALDPIEKKPLNNYKPGTKVLSFGGVSCNFRCPFCQNYEISFADLNFSYTKEILPSEVLKLAKEYNADGVAWTYNEPSIWHEYAIDCNKLLKENGFFTVYVTNGYSSPEAISQLKGLLDAANIDVKAFNQRFYRELCKASLEKVLRTVKEFYKSGVFIELTYLIIPGENDSKDEIRSFAEWVCDLDKRIPVHFSRFHPDFKMLNKSVTPLETLEMAIEIAKDVGVEYVYIGNVWGHRYENTYCPNCGAKLIEREGFYVLSMNLDGNRCPECGYKQNIVI